MSDTLTTLQVQVRNYLREPAGTPGQIWTDTIVNQAINQSVRQLEDLCLQHGPWFLEATVTQNIVSGTYAYSFPSAGTGLFLRKIRSIGCYMPGDDTSYPSRPLQEISLLTGQQAFSPPLLAGGRPTWFWLTSQNSIVIYPKPMFSQTAGLVWQIYKSLIVMASGSDAVPSPDGDTYSEIIIFDTVSKLLAIDEEVPSARTQWFKQMYEERKLEFVAFLAKGRGTKPKQMRVVGY